MKTMIVTISQFCYDKDGITKPYYQLVIADDYGFKVKKITKSLYVKLAEMESLYFYVDKLLYDESGRVCEIQ